MPSLALSLSDSNFVSEILVATHKDEY